MSVRSFSGRMLLVLLLLNLAACSSYKNVRIESAMGATNPPGVYNGSLVKVTTFDRKTDLFRVTRITETGLGNDAVFYPYEAMRKLEVEKGPGDRQQTLSVVLGVIGVAALVALIANADSVSVCSPSPCPPGTD